MGDLRIATTDVVGVDFSGGVAIDEATLAQLGDELGVTGEDPQLPLDAGDDHRLDGRAGHDTTGRVEFEFHN